MFSSRSHTAATEGGADTWPAEVSVPPCDITKGTLLLNRVHLSLLPPAPDVLETQIAGSAGGGGFSST